MHDFEQIYSFALQWKDKFYNQQIDCSELHSNQLAIDCEKLGFNLDDGHRFVERYGKAAYDYEALESIFDKVEDILLLGSAIYLNRQFCVYNELAMTSLSNRSWFLIAFQRLIQLTIQNFCFFTGTPRKIRIISNNISYGNRQDIKEPVEQRFTIYASGQVYYDEYECNDGRYKKVKTLKKRIGKEVAKDILNKTSSIFRKTYDMEYRTDIGSWNVSITNTKNEIYQYRGSLDSYFYVEDV